MELVLVQNWAEELKPARADERVSGACCSRGGLVDTSSQLGSSRKRPIRHQLAKEFVDRQAKNVVDHDSLWTAIEE